ncbi:MAG: ImmA/IrrE family metallo-endopeptidase [Chloroflexi bacterium]|nr:ImmA/IrrE family metallo-endopeptidase [Chloroflexota bacterium]
MNLAQRRSQEIRRRYHVQKPGDITRVLDAEDVHVFRFPFVGRLEEMIVYNWIGIQVSLVDSRRVHELLAHAFGHYLLHAGNQPFYYLQHQRAVARQWEKQAWDFAFELLMPAEEVERRLRARRSDDDLREHFQVSEEFFQQRMKAWGEECSGNGVIPTEEEEMNVDPDFSRSKRDSFLRSLRQMQ